MTIHSEELLLGYEYDTWYGYGEKKPIMVENSNQNSGHSLFCGMSGSGKSYFLIQYFARMCIQEGGNVVCYMADYKRDDAFAYLRKCLRYYAYDKTIEALEIVYGILHRRQSGEDDSRHLVVLIWDEYTSNILSLKELDKKKAEKAMRMVAEILMLGRTMNCRICISSQSAYASVYPEGSRINFGVISILGAPLRAIYELLLPKEYIECFGERQFKGEGVVLLQGADLHFIKVPVVRNEEKLKSICVDALTR